MRLRDPTLRRNGCQPRSSTASSNRSRSRVVCSLDRVQADRQELIDRGRQADHREIGHRRLREPPGTLGQPSRVASNANGEAAPIHPGSGGSLVDDIGRERPDRHSSRATEPFVAAGHHEVGAPGGSVAPHRTGPLRGVEDEPCPGLFGGRSQPGNIDGCPRRVLDPSDRNHRRTSIDPGNEIGRQVGLGAILDELDVTRTALCRRNQGRVIAGKSVDTGSPSTPAAAATGAVPGPTARSRRTRSRCPSSRTDNNRAARSTQVVEEGRLVLVGHVEIAVAHDAIEQIVHGIDGRVRRSDPGRPG